MHTFHPLCVLAAMLLVTGCSQGKQEAPKTSQAVTVVTLKRQPFTRSVSLPGRTTAFLTSPVTPQVTGIIQKRLFDEGSEVKAGQLLYQVDPAPYQATYDADQAELAKARAALLSAQPIAKRDEALAHIDAISQQTLETSRATLREDEAAVQSAQAALESARINLNYTRVTAPIAGTIGASSYTPGALVTANQTSPLTTIYAYDPIYVDVTQSSADVLQLRKALADGRLQKDDKGRARISLTLEDGSPYSHAGSLQFAGVGVDQATGTITLRAIVPNPEKLLLPGMYVHANINEGVDDNALLVPQQAVTHDPRGNATALVVNAQNKVELRTVTEEGTSSTNWVISDGVKAGERVILEGSQYVKPGDTVQATEAAPAVAAAGGN
ncbi:efflux RND transporter periplasmic adaptor subunit [Pseudomonas putida]